MSEITIGEILEDLRVAEEVLRKFERRYWIASEQFYELYNQGLLDHGEHAEGFSEWAARSFALPKPLGRKVDSTAACPGRTGRKDRQCSSCAVRYSF